MEGIIGGMTTGQLRRLAVYGIGLLARAGLARLRDLSRLDVLETWMEYRGELSVMVRAA